MNISDEAVEAAARAIDDTWNEFEWGHYIPESDKEPLREQARRILEAAAPHLTTQLK